MAVEPSFFFIHTGTLQFKRTQSIVSRQTRSLLAIMSTPTPKLVNDMTPEERLQSLREWAEEQKYVKPGEGGTLSTYGLGKVQQLAYKGPVKFVPHQYTAPIAPPSYETAMAEDAQKEKKKKGAVKRWLEKRKLKEDGDKDVIR